ncbi:MAG: hypothetical protein MI976_11395 [Pseudomonadales bacterium]|nr:hypothetical protein [Pseudomonadales bacterium]
MKTWWHYYPMLIIVALIPLGIGALPTIELNGHYLGGGPVRQFGVNFIAGWLPDQAGNVFITEFMANDPQGEYILYLPFAINTALIISWIAYGTGQTIISLNNWATSKKYHSQRLAAKQ